MSTFNWTSPVKRTALFLAVVLATIAGVIGVSASPAGALCDYGDEYGYSLYPGWGSEDSNGPQCGGSYENGSYSGLVGDTLTDGSCVTARYRDYLYQGTQGSECTTGSTNSYGFNDQTGDHQADARLCRNQGCTGWNWSRGY